MRQGEGVDMLGEDGLLSIDLEVCSQMKLKDVMTVSSRANWADHAEYLKE